MNDKQQLREAARAHRRTLACLLPDFAMRIAAFAGDLGAREDAAVAGYWPFREEADPRPLMEALTAKGHPLAMPRIARRAAPLEFRRWIEGDPMRPNAFGIAEPLNSAEIVAPAVVLVPLLAFDKAGYRLGYGGGYYDRTLAALREAGGLTAIGIAYAGQEVAALPHREQDQRLDMVLTERGLRRFPVAPMSNTRR